MAAPALIPPLNLRFKARKFLLVEPYLARVFQRHCRFDAFGEPPAVITDPPAENINPFDHPAGWRRPPPLALI
ncbi:MAG TPA: hypothetical protein VGU20_19905 [Stellaceae bacterium]|nr:hypothetical protein [Stellaceae bacterium]